MVKYLQSSVTYMLHAHTRISHTVLLSVVAQLIFPVFSSIMPGKIFRDAWANTYWRHGQCPMPARRLIADRQKSHDAVALRETTGGTTSEYSLYGSCLPHGCNTEVYRRGGWPALNTGEHPACYRAIEDVCFIFSFPYRYLSLWPHAMISLLVSSFVVLFFITRE